MRRTLIAIAVLLLALAAALAWLIGSGALLESVRARLVDEATRSLGRTVTIDRLLGDPVRGLVLGGVRIAGPPGAAGAFFTSPRVTVSLDPLRLLRDLGRGRGVAASITRVDLDRPVLALARDARGAWNFADILARRPAGAALAAFRATVEVREGSLTFSDARRRPPRAGAPSPFSARFDRVTGTLDFSRAPRVGVVVDAVNTDGRTPALLRVTGTATLGEATFDLDLDARGGSVDHWGPYLVRLPQVAWGGGTVDGTIHLLASRWGEGVVLDYRGALVLRDGQAVLLPQRARLSHIDGPLAVDNLGVATEGLTFTLDASPVWVRGRITHHAGVALDLAVRSDALDLRTVQKLLFPRARIQLAGRAGGDARIVGPLLSPRLEGEVVRAAGRIDGQPFRAASGRFSYYGGLLVFDGISAAAAGGRIQGHASLNLGTGSVFLLAGAQSIDTRRLPRPILAVDPGVSGRVSGVVAAAGRPGRVIAQGRVAMGRGRLLGVGVDRLEAIFGYDTGRVDLDRLEARSGRTQVRASGEVARSGALALAVSGLDVDLRAVADRLGLRGWLAGTADVQGRVGGTTRAPALVGTVRGRDGRLGPVPFDDARGRLRVTATGLQTPGVVLVDEGGRYFASGEVRWGAPARVDLTVRAADVAAQRLLDIARLPVSLSGTVESTVHVSGPLRRPVVEGGVVLRRGQIAGQPIEQAEAVFRWTGSRLLLDRLSARTNASMVEARGTVTRTGQLGITFSATDLDLADIAVLRTDALRAAGTVDLRGTLTGTARVPTVTATLASTTLVLNGQRFTRADGAVRYRRGRLQFAPLALNQDGGVFTLSGGIVLQQDPALDIQIASQGGGLAALLGLARVRVPFPLDGRIDGVLSATGPLSNPRAALDLTLSDGRLGDRAIRQAAVGATLDAHTVTLRTLSVTPEQGELVGAGRINLRGQSEVEFDGTGLSLDLLRPLFGIRRPLAGTLDFTLQLSGELNDPLVGLAVSTTDGAIGTAVFDRLVVQAFYRNGQLNVEHGLLQEGRHRVRLTGSVPFNPARLRFDETRPMKLRLELADSDLSVLGLLTDRVERAEGRLTGEVAVTGTVARPHLEGSLAVADGTVALRGVAPPLASVAGEIALSEDVVRVTRLNARLGDGEVALAGTVGLRNFRPDRLALQLSASGARLEAPQVYTGTVDAALRIGGTAAQPEVGGTVQLSHGELTVARLQREPGAAGARSSLNPALAVELAAGDALWVTVGGLRFQVHGAVRTAGTWQQPRLAGEITADRGSFVAFNNTFTLTEGQASFAEFRGATPYIDARAETRINVVQRAVSGTGGRVVTARVFLHVTGTPDALTLDLTSDPPLPREEITAGLARQVGVTRLLEGESLETVLRAELGNALFGQVGRAVARAFALEEFTIEYDFVRPLTLRIGKVLIRDLYLTLTSEFGLPRRVVWALEYRLTPTNMLTFAVDNLGVWEFMYRITYRF